MLCLLTSLHPLLLWFYGKGKIGTFSGTSLYCYINVVSFYIAFSILLHAVMLNHHVCVVSSRKTKKQNQTRKCTLKEANGEKMSKIQAAVHISQHPWTVTFKVFWKLKAPLHISFLKYLRWCSVSSSFLLIESCIHFATLPQGITHLPFAVPAPC